MPEALDPRLTPLDERVLAIVRERRRGLRASEVALIANLRLGVWSPGRTTPEEVRGILRGFEHLGHVSGRGGWWRAV